MGFWLFLSWAVVATGFTGATAFRVWRRRRRVTEERHAPVAGLVVLLRPVDAPTDTELACLGATPEAAGPWRLRQVVVSAARPPGLGADIDWLESDPTTPNRKVGHLARGFDFAKKLSPVAVVCVDADVRVDHSLLESLVSAVGRGHALAWAAPRPDQGTTFATHVVHGLLVQSHQSFAALDAVSSDPKPVCGKAFAVSGEAQSVLSSLGDCLGEDLELATRLTRMGRSVVQVAAPAVMPQSPELAWRTVHARFTRWLQVLRTHRGALFPTVPLFIAPTPLVLAWALGSHRAEALGAAAILAVGRTVLAVVLEGRAGPWWQWLAAEFTLLTCWAAALGRGRRVTWRGRRLVLDDAGHLHAR